MTTPDPGGPAPAGLAARMNEDAEALAGGAYRLGCRLLAETGDTRRAWKHLALALVRDRTPAQLAGALAAATLERIQDAAAHPVPEETR